VSNNIVDLIKQLAKRTGLTLDVDLIDSGVAQFRRESIIRAR